VLSRVSRNCRGRMLEGIHGQRQAGRRGG
jgi:hypothetical protein